MNLREHAGAWSVRIADLAGTIACALEDSIAVAAMFVVGRTPGHSACASSAMTCFSPRVVAVWLRWVPPRMSRS
jgi:hypothetical protein